MIMLSLLIKSMALQNNLFVHTHTVDPFLFFRLTEYLYPPRISINFPLCDEINLTSSLDTDELPGKLIFLCTVGIINAFRIG